MSCVSTIRSACASTGDADADDVDAAGELDDDGSGICAGARVTSSGTSGGSAASSSGIGVEGRVPAINLHGANAAAANDPTTWTDLHREMKGHLHEARLQLARRDAANDSGAGSTGPGGKQGSTAAVEAGAEVLHAPRDWPEYHPGYYAVFLRDPNGHNAEAVCHTGGPSGTAPAGLAESSG